MKKLFLSTISIALILLLPFRAAASWYEVTGVATIVSSDEAARLHALEDALFKAVNFSGADIGSISNLMPYLKRTAKNTYLPTMKSATFLSNQNENAAAKWS